MTMPNCVTCGTVIPYPFKCNFCGGTFCAEHRLPEAHACPFLSDARSNVPREEKKDTATATQMPVSESEPPPVGKPSDFSARPYYDAPRPRRKSRTIFALCTMLIVLLLVAGYFSYGVGYDSGSKNASVSSYNVGFNNGNTSGYSLGYDAGVQTGNVSGYDLGYTEGLSDGAGHGFTVRDPTYQEMLNFITSDQTDKHQYTVPTYVCWNFAADVKNNAFTEGYRCGLVVISFADSSAGHSVICFKTIDHGLIFIEPQDDAIASLVIGQHYWDRAKYAPTYDDTIVSFTIVW